MTATLQGFVAREVVDVRVGLGQIKKVDFACRSPGVTETVQVTAESPLVDVSRARAQTNIRAEQIELLPQGRDFTTLVTQAPGANNETKLGGLSIDGASAGENRYIVDGIETTNLQSGLSGKNVHRRLRRRSPGQVERLHRRVRRRDRRRDQRHHQERHQRLPRQRALQLRGQRAAAGRRGAADAAHRALTDSDQLREYVELSEGRAATAYEPGFALGGPIVKNRAWFFGAYQPALTTRARGRHRRPRSTRPPAVSASSRSSTVQYHDRAT